MAAPFDGQFQFEIPGISFKVSGGAALWERSNADGSDDSVASATGATVNGAAVRGSAARDSIVAGSSLAAPNFKTAADPIFYPADFNSDAGFDLAPIGSAITHSRVVAISLAITAADVASMVVTLPDGAVMTMVGVAAAPPLLFAA